MKNSREPFSNNKNYLPLRIETDFRTILERFGTEAMKPIFGKEVWVKLVVDQIKEAKSDTVIISDFRMVEEYEYVKEHLTDYEIITINIQRDDTLKSSHISNQELSIDFTHTIDNNGDLEELEIEALKLILTEDILDRYFLKECIQIGNFWSEGVCKEDYKIEYGDFWIEEIAEIFYKTKGYDNWLS